ncbi:hypothetical protein AAG570_000032, partial [Ranatra chinensis]
SFSEKIVLTPKGKTANSTTILIERRVVSDESTNKENVHVAGGDHTGIVVNKISSNDIEDTYPEASLTFNVFLVNAQDGSHTQESRTLRFWFKPQVSNRDHASLAQEFFKELVSPHQFPRDYVGFIKLMMKLMQNKYPSMCKLEVELKQLEERPLPIRPTKPNCLLIDIRQHNRSLSASADESILGKEVPLTEDKVLELIESAYPNPVTVEDLAKDHFWDEEIVAKYIESLKTRGLVKGMDHGAFTRVMHHESNVQIVKQMPTIISSKQPTIAIITAQYCEKLAVDAMIENKETFVRYTTLGVPTSPDGSYPTSTLIKATRFGESNVYTLGNIGSHRIVCTKLPTVGYTREAITAAGNTTTRLLGTFQKVDYVFLVGVGGGVPHYTDYTKHVRLGDVVVSHSCSPNKFVYTYCENVKYNDDGNYIFECKNYCPSNKIIQNIAMQLKAQNESTGEAPWFNYMREGLSMLESQIGEHDFSRPSIDTDKLYMAVGERDVIEVAHPQPHDVTDLSRMEGCPRLHLGPMASGRAVSRDAVLREAFSKSSQALAFDFESDTVVESVVGNCGDSWALVRGIADYKDGLKKGPWQPYASLAAAAVVKAVICSLDEPSE